ncbi:gamma-2-syntrophin isoform X5 [Prionailurus iriomotensis]
MTRTGLALLHHEGSGSPCDVRLKLTREVLTIQKQDVVCVRGSSHGAHWDETCSQRSAKYLEKPGRSPHESVNGRELVLPLISTRHRTGGAEHRVPVVISKIFRGHAGPVNGINVEHATHEEVVHLLRNAGDEVAITVDYLREAPAFLKLPLGSPGPAGDHSSGASSPLFDSGLHLNSNPSSTDSPSGAFQVLAVDGVRTGVLQFHTARESADWLRAVSATIRDLTLESMKMVNEGCSPCDQVVHMGWVRERLEGTSSRETFRSKFLALKGSLLYVFSTAPVSTLDWVRAEKTYNLCELWRADDGWLHEDCHLGPPGFTPQRPFSFSVLVGHGQSRVFSVDLGSELAAWERSFQRATFKEVQRSRSKTYTCSWQGEMLCFTVDFALGFTCSDSKTKNVLWRFKFSQLKGSSDDGNARVKLLFQHPDTKQIEVKGTRIPGPDSRPALCSRLPSSKGGLSGPRIHGQPELREEKCFC